MCPGAQPYVLAFAAGDLLYAAMSDLIPHLHRGESDPRSVRQVLLIAAGVTTIILLHEHFGH